MGRGYHGIASVFISHKCTTVYTVHLEYCTEMKLQAGNIFNESGKHIRIFVTAQCIYIQTHTLL